MGACRTRSSLATRGGGSPHSRLSGSIPDHMTPVTRSADSPPLVVNIHWIKDADVANVPSFGAIRAEVTYALHGGTCSHTMRESIGMSSMGSFPRLILGGIIDTSGLARSICPGCPNYNLLNSWMRLTFARHSVQHSPRGPLSFRDLLRLAELPTTIGGSQRGVF